MSRGGEHGHVGACFGDADLCGGGAESWDADQELPGETKGFHRLLDPGTEVLDLGGVGVDPVQIQFRQLAVMSEATEESLMQASSRSFSRRWISRVRSRVRLRSSRIGVVGMNEAQTMP